MESFGEDVAAVIKAAGAERAILIGHSMGGQVIACAARILPGRVSGLIGVDTLENVGYVMKPEEQEAMLAPFREDFPAETARFAGEMLSPAVERSLRSGSYRTCPRRPPGGGERHGRDDLSTRHQWAAVFEGPPPRGQRKRRQVARGFQGQPGTHALPRAIVIADADRLMVPGEGSMTPERAIRIILWERASSQAVTASRKPDAGAQELISRTARRREHGKASSQGHGSTGKPTVRPYPLGRPGRHFLEFRESTLHNWICRAASSSILLPSLEWPKWA